jgi:hypothetical protein
MSTIRTTTKTSYNYASCNNVRGRYTEFILSICLSVPLCVELRISQTQICPENISNCHLKDLVKTFCNLKMYTSYFHQDTHILSFKELADIFHFN